MPAPDRRMLTDEEAADYCGFKSVAGFRAHIQVLPHKFGSQAVRYDRRDLDEYLDNLRNPSAKKGLAEAAGNAGARGGR